MEWSTSTNSLLGKVGDWKQAHFLDNILRDLDIAGHGVLAFEHRVAKRILLFRSAHYLESVATGSLVEYWLPLTCSGKIRQRFRTAMMHRARAGADVFLQHIDMTSEKSPP